MMGNNKQKNRWNLRGYSNDKNKKPHYFGLFILLVITIFPIGLFDDTMQNNSSFSVYSQSLDISDANPHSQYSPAIKNPLEEGDVLVFSLVQNLSGVPFEGKLKYVVTDIITTLGIQYIKVDIYNQTKGSLSEDWNISKQEIIIGQLNLNQITITDNIWVQNKYFGFEYHQSENPEITAVEIFKSYVLARFDVVVEESTQFLKDFFQPELNMTISNITHSGNIIYQYYYGILSKKIINISNLGGTDQIITRQYLLLNESTIASENYNAWGNPTQNIPVTANNQIINTDYLIYDIANITTESEYNETVKFTITSIDPDESNRDTIITTTREEWDLDTSDWKFKRSELLFVDHSSPFHLARYKSNFLLQPSTMSINTEDTMEELEATKYWIEYYKLWDSFSYSIGANSFSFTLNKSDEMIQVNANYGPQMVLLDYNLIHTVDSTIIEQVTYSLQVFQSKIKKWLDTPPAAPTLDLDSLGSTYNTNINLSWNKPFFTQYFTFYYYMIPGTDSQTSASVKVNMLYPLLEEITVQSLTLNFEQNQTLFFAVKAFNPANVASTFSNMVKVFIQVETNTSISTWWIIIPIVLAGIGISLFLIKKLKKKEKSELTDFQDFS